MILFVNVIYNPYNLKYKRLSDKDEKGEGTTILLAAPLTGPNKISALLY